MYYLTNEEKKRLVNAIRAAYTIPLIDDVEDYIWEAIFAYSKGISTVDPLTNIRSKSLFDVVDQERKIGWSIKAAQRKITLPCEYEVVIQRADIFKKAKSLGYDSLSTDSPTDQLGSALLKHWYGRKVEQDAKSQGVRDKRVCILLKSLDRRDYVYLEEQLVRHNENDLKWYWTNEKKTGLQARREKDDVLIFRWFPNQKHFFERFTFPADAYRFRIEPQRLATDEVVELLLARLEDKL